MYPLSFPGSVPEGMRFALVFITRELSPQGSLCLHLPLGTCKGTPVLQDFCLLCLEMPFGTDACRSITLWGWRSISYINMPALWIGLCFSLFCDCFLQPLSQITASQSFIKTQTCSDISVGLAIQHKLRWAKIKVLAGVPFWRVWGQSISLPSRASKGSPHSWTHGSLPASSKPAMLHLSEKDRGSRILCIRKCWRRASSL